MWANSFVLVAIKIDSDLKGLFIHQLSIRYMMCNTDKNILMKRGFKLYDGDLFQMGKQIHCINTSIWYYIIVK